MLQNKINGVLGIWIIALAFLGFSDSMQRFLLVVTGLVVAIVSFYGESLFKPSEELIKDISEIQPVKQITETEIKESQETSHGENQIQ